MSCTIKGKIGKITPEPWESGIINYERRATNFYETEFGERLREKSNEKKR